MMPAGSWSRRHWPSWGVAESGLLTRALLVSPHKLWRAAGTPQLVRRDEPVIGPCGATFEDFGDTTPTL
jgi:hypothetical protein